MVVALFAVVAVAGVAGFMAERVEGAEWRGNSWVHPLAEGSFSGVAGDINKMLVAGRQRGVAFDPAGNRLWLLGSGKSAIANPYFEIDIETMAVKALGDSSNGPGQQRYGVRGAYSPSSNSLLVCGGPSAPFECFSHNLTAGMWETLDLTSDPNAPPTAGGSKSQAMHADLTDPAVIISWGGFDRSNTQNLHAYDTVAKVWIDKVGTVTGTQPPGDWYDNFGQRTRDNVIQDLEEFLEGKAQPIEGQGDGFSLAFNFEGYDFIYEEVEVHGFGSKNFKGYLKIQTPSSFILHFTEKKAKTRIRSDIFIASDIKDDSVKKEERLVIPEKLKEFSVHTNNISFANHLFDSAKFLRIVQQYKNEDHRKSYSSALKITDGLISLEFHEMRSFKPSLLHFHQDIPSIETHIERLIELYGIIKTIQENIDK